MNTGSKNAQSVGFDISYLPKLSNTKDRENKNTLLHFLVEYVERDYPELLAFADEMMHLDNASRVNVENIKKVLTQMDSSIKNLEMDLKNAQRSPTEKDDRFVEAMGSFCQQAREQCDILQAMAQKMDTLYSSLAEYFVFDKQKYSLEEFMSDIKKFKDQFKVSFEKIGKVMKFSNFTKNGKITKFSNYKKLVKFAKLIKFTKHEKNKLKKKRKSKYSQNS